MLEDYGAVQHQPVTCRDAQPSGSGDAPATEPPTEDARRAMYERIARGHALAQVEETARRRWQHP